MIFWAKKHFIPHAGNDHQPHILRTKSIRSIIILIIFFEAFAFLLPTLTDINKTGGMAAVLPAILSDLTNKERNDEKLNPLTINPLLNKAAEMKANDMATHGYFAHTSPEGKTPWYWIEQVGYKYKYAGENLAINFSDSKDVTNAWMHSPTHKANITKENYTEVGTGVATGMYKGQKTVFVAQIYANPLPKSPDQTKSVIDNKKIENVIKIIEKESKNVLGAVAEVETIAPTPTFLQKAFASPQSTTNVILLIFFSIIVIAIVLYTIMRIKDQHVGLTTNGLIVVAIIGAILLVNNYLSKHNMVVLESFDYVNQDL